LADSLFSYPSDKWIVSLLDYLKNLDYNFYYYLSISKERIIMTANRQTSLATMQKWIDTHRSQWLEEFKTFLSFPSISSEPQFKPSVLECAQWLSHYLTQLNFKVESWPTKGHPVIFASNLQAGPHKPTLLIYHHYDVQPADPLEEWKSPPFQPTLRDGQIYARGAQDNKGQCFYVLQALKMLQEQKGNFPINIKLCIEGEEEIGSAGLASVLDQKKEQLKADYLAIVDLGLRKANTPTLTLGIRGILTLDVEVQGSDVDLHSGSHGGIVPNPIHALVKLLASLRDDKGEITIPGFYQNVKEMSAEERARVSFHFDEKEYQQQMGAFPTGGEIKYSVLERAWLRPTLEINGIQGGYTGKGFKTVIPAKAFAKISCRLVPDQEPEEIGRLIASYLKENAPSGVKVTVHVHPGQGKAVRISPDATVVKAFAKSFAEVFAAPCEFIFEGASIPIVPELSVACGGETILLGLGLTTDQIHAPNEHFGVDRLEKGMLMMARAIELLGE
jgi:acetylornithine deacetylase/succinyl-diaminopimelate desuccinylase-like protein